MTIRRHAMATAVACAFLMAPGAAFAAKCGNTSSGFDAWKRQMAGEAQSAGVGQRGIAALMVTRYANDTIRADRGQKSFKYSLKKFMQVRGANTIVAKGKRLKKSKASLLKQIEARYGVDPQAVLATRDNAARNDVSDRIEVLHSDGFEGHSSLPRDISSAKPFVASGTEAKNGGTGGIRTLGSLLGYVPLARECFRPLSHRSWVAGREL